jgi:hypothetical protein
MCRVHRRSRADQASFAVQLESAAIIADGTIGLDRVPRCFALRVTAQPPHWTVVCGKPVEVAIKRRRMAIHFLVLLKLRSPNPVAQWESFVIPLASYFCDQAPDTSSSPSPVRLDRRRDTRKCCALRLSASGSHRNERSCVGGYSFASPIDVDPFTLPLLDRYATLPRSARRDCSTGVTSSATRRCPSTDRWVPSCRR